MPCLWILDAQTLFKPDTDFKYEKCRGEVSNASIPDSEPVVINGKEIEKVCSFCYLGDFIGQRGGCFDATTARIRSLWKKFRDLLPIPTCCGLSLKSHGYAYNACVHSVCFMPVKRGLQHRKMSLVLTTMI